MLLDSESSTLISQLVVSICIGVLLSCLTSSFILVIASSLIIEAFMYYSVRCDGRCNLFTRIAPLFGYVFGWILGRTAYGVTTYVVSEELDEKLM